MLRECHSQIWVAQCRPTQVENGLVDVNRTGRNTPVQIICNFRGGGGGGGGGGREERGAGGTKTIANSSHLFHNSLSLSLIIVVVVVVDAVFVNSLLS